MTEHSRPVASFMTSPAYLMSASRLVVLLGLALLPLSVEGEMRITASPTPLAPPQGHPSVLVHHALDDKGGNTSLRFTAGRKVDRNKYYRLPGRRWTICGSQYLPGALPH